MTEQRPSKVLGSLPHTRPHRRSQKRPANDPASPPDGPRAKPAPPAKPVAPAKPAASAKPSAGGKAPERPATKRATARPRSERLRQPAQPAGTPASRGHRKPVPASAPDVLSTAVKAAAELTEIGLSVSTRALRKVVSRLPRP